LYAIPVSVIPARLTGTNTMKRSKHFPYCMTLRLTAPMESELENLAYDLRLSKAGFIRRCIRQAIAEAYDHRTPSKSFQFQGGAL
jgi:hypothetical protein